MSKSAHGHPSSFQGPSAALAHNNDVERRIQAATARDGIRIQEFFIDFDKLRKGVVTESAFRTCLGTLQINLNAREVEDLVARYRCPDQPGLVNYARFVANIN